MSLEAILRSVLTSCYTEIDIWEKLVNYFSENWDGQDILEQVKDLSRKQLGGNVDHIKTTTQYFRALENNFSDKNDLLEFIINLTRFLNFHTECGSVNVSDSLQNIRKTLRTFREDCIRRGIFRDKNFVGRAEEIEKVKDAIRGNSRKGILICGMGGMGKTSLASTICYELRSEDWKTTKIELREQRTFWHFLRTTLHSIRDLRGSMAGQMYSAKSTEEDDMNTAPDGENIMQQKLIDYLNEHQKRKQIYMFDNLDDATSDKLEKNKIMEFFKILLRECKDQPDCVIRIIITSRENFLLTSSDELKQMMNDIEVKGLDHASAVELVKRCTDYGQTILSTDIMHSVVRVCGSCPLAIRVICGILNTSPLSLIKNLERQAESLSSSFLRIDYCLQQPYERLEEYKHVLCKLSLFGTAKFDLHSAAFVIFGKKFKEDKIRCQEELQLILLMFKSRHLLEIDNYTREEGVNNDFDPERTETSSYLKIFSLHPLVYNFVTEKSNDIIMSQEMKRAKYNYICLFNELVIGIGEAYDTNVLIAREKSEKYKVHISKYIQLLEELKDISNESNLENALSNEQVAVVNKSIQLIYNQDEHISFLQSQFTKTKDGTITNCSWQVEQITAMVGYGMSFDNMEEKCDLLIGKLNKFGDDQLALIYKSRMLWSKGSIAMEMDDGRNAIHIFQKAREILESEDLCHKRQCQIYLADIYNSIGCLYCRKLETENSMKWHKQALAINDKLKLKNENTLTYCANLGACHFRLGIQHNRSNDKTKMKAEMEKALRYYNESIIVAKYLKEDRTVAYAKKLKNRGDVLVMLRRFEESEKDYQMGLEIAKKLHSTPSRTYIIMQHARGTLVRYQTKDITAKRHKGSFSYRQDEEYDTDVTSLSLKGLEIYEDLVKIINVDLLPTDNRDYNGLKKNHLYFLKQFHDQEKLNEAQMFYKNYEAGVSGHSEASEDTFSLSSSGESSDAEGTGNKSSSRIYNDAHNKEESNGREEFCYKSRCEDCGHSSCNQRSCCKVENIDRNESICQNNNAILGQTECITNSSSTSHEASDASKINDKINILENDQISDITRDENEEAILRTNERKLNFKLPLASSFLQSMGSPYIGLPQKIKIRRGSSSSSGISSLGSITPDSDRISIKSARSSRELTSERSFEDDVFTMSQQTLDDRKECSTDQGISKRRASLQLFGSGSLNDDYAAVYVAKKLKSDTRPLMTKSASLDAIHTTTHGKQAWLMKEKLTPWFEDTNKSSQTDIGSLGSIANDIETLIPAVKPRMRTLLHKLDIAEAQLIDDQKGRPIVRYSDEGFQNESDGN